MSARDALHDHIHGPDSCDPPCGLSKEVGALLEDYRDEVAHELAEKQRAHFGVGDAPVRTHCGPGCDFCRGVTEAADLIDPKKEG